MSKPFLHHFRLPVWAASKNTGRIKIHKDTVLRTERQAKIDLFRSRIRLDIFPHYPFCRSGYAIDTWLVPAGQVIMRHAQCLEMDKQQVLPKFTYFLFPQYMGIAEIKLAGIGPGFDKVLFLRIQSKSFLAELIHDTQCRWIQRHIFHPGQLQQGKRHFQNLRLWNFKKILLFDCLYKRWQPVSHAVPVTVNDLISYWIKVLDIKALTEHTIKLHFLFRILTEQEILIYA